jgi:CRP/FNR family transcriptional regulator, cyclic AMP receptor protein
METFNIFKHNKNFEAYEAGQIIFEQGDKSDEMYVVLEGKVEIVVNGKVIEIVEQGGVFGELAMVDRMPRSATAIATVDCKLVPIKPDQFNFMVQNTPYFANRLLRVISKRLN